MQHESVRTSEDVLRRRSRLGLGFHPEQQAALGRFMAASRETRPAA
jgi:glycerol-3-phosphate dehydrogenase